MKIGAILPQSLIDYPGKVSPILFTIGCNFRCPHCYNGELAKSKTKPISDKKIEEFIDERKNFIDGLILSGGEPTLQKDILNFAKKIKKKGISLGLETNGTNPDVLKELIDNNLVEFVGMDVKTSLDKYDKAAGVKVNTNKIKQSINLLKSSKIKYEFRVTVIPPIFNKETINKIGKLIEGSKVKLQQFVNDKDMIDNSYKEIDPLPSNKLKEFKKILEEYSCDVEIRGIN